MLHRAIITTTTIVICGTFAVSISGQTVGNRASSVDTSAGSRDYVTSSSPLPDGGTIMSSHYPSRQSATYVAEALPTQGYPRQGYAPQSYPPPGYAPRPMYQNQPQYNNNSQNNYPQPAYRPPNQQPVQQQPVHQQRAPESQANNTNGREPNQDQPDRSPTRQVSYNSARQNNYQSNQPQYRMPAQPNYPANTYRQPQNNYNYNYSNWRSGYQQPPRTASNSNVDNSGLRWQTAGTSSYSARAPAYTAQAPACCGSTPPANNVYAQGYQPPPQQYAPVQQPPAVYQPPAPPVPPPGYNPYGYVNPAAQKAKWRPLIPLRALPAGTYVGQGIIGQPVAYVDGEPVRNFLRYIAP